MLHGMAAMVRGLRGGPGLHGHTQAHGLVYGQGEFVTKHHALVLSNHDSGHRHTSLAEIAVDVPRPNAVPAIVSDARGAVRIETSTVVFDAQGQPSHGSVVVRTAENHRSLGRGRVMIWTPWPC